MKAGRYKERVAGILVWFTIERLNVYNEKTKLYDEGNFLCYYSFFDPEGSSRGELIKDDNNKPVSWRTKSEALSYARQFIKNISK